MVRLNIATPLEESSIHSINKHLLNIYLLSAKLGAIPGDTILNQWPGRVLEYSRRWKKASVRIILVHLFGLLQQNTTD